MAEETGIELSPEESEVATLFCFSVAAALMKQCINKAVGHAKAGRGDESPIKPYNYKFYLK
jgi:hypothetical protein